MSSQGDQEKLSPVVPAAAVPFKDEVEQQQRVDPGKVFRKLDLRLLILVTFLYLLSFLDRANIGNAKIAGLVTDLHLTGLKYNLCVAVFFITNCLFEVPSNLALKVMKPSRWIPLIMLCWGIVMTSMAFVENFGGLLTARLFLGVTEAGVLPGITFYLCTWYPRTAQALRISVLSGTAALGGAFGGLLAFAIEKMGGIRGVAGWSWIFLLEGLVTTVMALLSSFLIQDYPENATFLTNAERTWLANTIKNDSAGLSKAFKWKFLAQALRDPHTYLKIGVFFFVFVPTYSFALFLPTIIDELGFSASTAQLLSVPPNAAGFILSVLFGVVSDRLRVRGPFVLAGSITALIGFVVLFATKSPGAGYAGAMIAGCGLFPGVSLALTWAGGNTGGEVKKAVVIAMVIGTGNLGGIVSAFIYRPQDSPRYHPGHATAISFLCVDIALCMVAMFEFARLNREKDVRGSAINLDGNQSEFEEMGDKSPLFRYSI